MKFLILISPLLLLLFTYTSHAQYYNAVDWGTYYNDSVHYPFLDFSNYDLIDQVIVDGNNPENFYVCPDGIVLNALLL